MISSYAAIRIKNALNKLDSQDNQNVELWKMQEAVNIATQRFVRRRLPKKEINNLVTEDIQILLKDVRLSGSKQKLYFQSHKLPDDYFGLSSVGAVAIKDECTGTIPLEWIEDSNVDDYLRDWNTQPSFKFEQAFMILSGNKIKAYHNGDFEIEELEMSYYKQPEYIQFPNQPLPGGGIGKDMKWEWKDDVSDMIIEESVWILAGNIGDYNRTQLSQQVITTGN